jgi:hypothetical protein
MKKSRFLNKLYNLILLISGFIIIGCSHSENTITLIPQGFIGTVRINFNQEDGRNKKYEAEKRVYEISEEGILNTKFEPQFGYHFPEYYFLTKDGKRTEIPVIFNLNKEVKDTLDKNKIYVYRFKSMGKVVNIDSIGNETMQNDYGINFTVGNPLN